MPIQNTERHARLDGARKDLLKAKLYRLVALLFFGCGVVLFFVFSARFVQGDLTVFSENPFLFLTLLVPFFPAYVFLHLSERKRKKALAVWQAEKSQKPS